MKDNLSSRFPGHFSEETDLQVVYVVHPHAVTVIDRTNLCFYKKNNEKRKLLELNFSRNIFRAADS